MFLRGGFFNLKFGDRTNSIAIFINQRAAIPEKLAALKNIPNVMKLAYIAKNGIYWILLVIAVSWLCSCSTQRGGGCHMSKGFVGYGR